MRGDSAKIINLDARNIAPKTGSLIAFIRLVKMVMFNKLVF